MRALLKVAVVVVKSEGRYYSEDKPRLAVPHPNPCSDFVCDHGMACVVLPRLLDLHGAYPVAYCYPGWV